MTEAAREGFSLEKVAVNIELAIVFFTFIITNLGL
jgi:hypothetical protein